MDSDDISPDYATASSRCADCESALAHDQRYCLNCGARRGPLPVTVAMVIDELNEPEPIVVVPAARRACRWR